jgi:predicted TIM-barrel fold metal-dependent hydrolase
MIRPQSSVGTEPVFGPDTWDAHAHVIGDPLVYPMAPGRAYTPAPASVDQYLAMLDRAGIARGVLVQPSIYGVDNRCLTDALVRAGGRLVGVAVPPPESTIADLEALHRLGVRGVRCNLINPGGLPLDTAIGWRDTMRALGWHVELHASINALPALSDLLAPFAVPVVIDHFGRPSSLQSPRLAELVGLVRAGACFVKLSAPYRISAQPPLWHEVAPIARRFLEANPAHCLWGSDWPHVDVAVPVRTDDVVAVLRDWCADDDLRSMVIRTSAGQLFNR